MASKPREPLRVAAVLLPLVALALAVLFSVTPLHAPLRQAALDAQMRWLATVPKQLDVIVLDIDDRSLSELKPWIGSWPLKRDTYAMVIDYLRELGARAIALDIVLADERPGDAQLVRALSAPGAPVVLAASALREAMSIEAEAGAPEGVNFALPPGTPAQHWAAWGLPSAALMAPLRHTGELGVITAALDDDGRLRRLPALHAVAGRALPSMPVALVMVTRRENEAALSYDPHERRFTLGPRLWPVDGDGMLTFDFASRLPSVEVLPFAAIARPALGAATADATLRDRIDGRVVFIGSSAFYGEGVQTSIGRRSDTAVLASAYSALADNDVLRPAWPALDLFLVALAMAPSLWAWRRAHSRPGADALRGLAAALAVVAASSGALTLWRVQSDPVLPLAAILSGWLLSISLERQHTRQVNRKLAYERAVADAATQAKSDLLAKVSQEIRTPMNALLGVADLLADTPLTTEQRRHVDVFRHAGRALAVLIDDLLDMSKIEARRLELDLHAFELEPLLDEQIALLGMRARERGLRLTRRVDDDVPAHVWGDRHRLAQVLTNLLGNALKFTQRGFVELHVERAEAQDMLRFSVQDSGIGVPPDKLESIFSPFTQADSSVTRNFGGTGLGLTIVRSLVELMGGRITVDSAPGRGSTFSFTVRLPAAPAAVPDGGAAPALGPALATPIVTEAPSALAASTPGTIRILLAEDNPTNVYLIEAMLAGLDCVIDVATDGREAVRKFRAGAFDLVLMDVQMPLLDGLAAAQELRRIEREQGRSRTPIVALTAHASERDRQRSLEAGCDAHLAKPLAKSTLLDAVARFAHAPMPPRRAAHSAPAGWLTKLEDSASPIDARSAVERLGGDTTLYERLLPEADRFMGEWPQRYAQARQRGDDAAAQRLTHDLKGIAAAVGADMLANSAQVLERSLRRADVNGCESLEARVRDALAVARTALQAVLAGPPAR
jgi:signal transduction histidine kinase/FixJ family two-component response regulator/HPt (histidine-containing phosphotransfer) domain-containing protein